MLLEHGLIFESCFIFINTFSFFLARTAFCGRGFPLVDTLSNVLFVKF